MSARILSVALAAAALAVSASSASAAYLSQDFESAATGAVVPPALGANYTSGRVDVVDSSTNPAHPFTNPGNGAQSLLLEDNADPSAANVSFQGATSITSGTFSFDFWITKDATWTTPFVDVRVGINAVTSGSDLGVWFALNASGGLTDFGGAGTLDQTYTFNAPHTMVIDFDAATDKWTGTLDNVPLTAGGGATTQFNFFTAMTSIQSVGFGSGYSTNTTSRGFVDNLLVVVPEPASLSLLAAGAGLMLLRPRRRRI